MVREDYKVSHRLADACEEDIKRLKCEHEDSTGHVQLGQILLCLEGALNEGQFKKFHFIIFEYGYEQDQFSSLSHFVVLNCFESDSSFQLYRSSLGGVKRMQWRFQIHSE
jgi:hypothetical protein